MWDRKLWGVWFSSPKTTGMLLGNAWDISRKMEFGNDPRRALLFTTRKAAREWCKDKAQIYSGRQDVCADWKFKAVRVRERVTVVRKNGLANK